MPLFLLLLPLARSHTFLQGAPPRPCDLGEGSEISRFQVRLLLYATRHAVCLAIQRHQKAAVSRKRTRNGTKSPETNPRVLKYPHEDPKLNKVLRQMAGRTLSGSAVRMILSRKNESRRHSR